MIEYNELKEGIIGRLLTSDRFFYFFIVESSFPDDLFICLFDISKNTVNVREGIYLYNKEDFERTGLHNYVKEEDDEFKKSIISKIFNCSSVEYL